MNKYKVEAGTHDQDGVTYEEGQVLESNHDLVKTFPGKFKALSGPTEDTVPKVKTKRITNVVESALDEPADEEGTSESTESESATKKATGAKKTTKKKTSKWT